MYLYYITSIIIVFSWSLMKEARMPDVVHIGEKLRETRTWRLLTQMELAEKAGVSQSTVVNIERNQSEPHFRTIRKLAKALDVDPTSLLER